MTRGLILALVLFPTLAPAQEARYELGRRVRAFEREWDLRADPEARRRAATHLADAVEAFFRLRLGEAGRSIGAARFALDSAGAPDPSRLWADSLAIRPASRLIGVTNADLPVIVDSFYAPGVERPAGARLRLSIIRADAAAGPSRVFDLGALPTTVALPLADLGPGDHRLRAEVLVEGASASRSDVGLSAAERPETRLDALQARLGAWAGAARPSDTDRATARSRLALLRALADGRPPETDYPAARLLDELEALADAVEAGRPFFGPDRPGDHYLTLVGPAGRATPARAFVPEAARSGRAVPLVVALHGAGGSENMFFDSYGAGAIVRLCRDRGWLLVSPRSPAFGGVAVDEVVAVMASLYPVDRGRVFLVGHSMGAAQAVAAASREPSRFAGVAALGGGGRVRASDGLRGLPFFVGVGTEDFARRGALGLARALSAAGVRRVELREYPGVEHLAIVQVALPDVLDFFDEIAGR